MHHFNIAPAADTARVLRAARLARRDAMNRKISAARRNRAEELFRFLFRRLVPAGANVVTGPGRR